MIRQLVELPEEINPPPPVEYDSEGESSDCEERERLRQAIALSLTSPEFSVPSSVAQPTAKPVRSVRFNLPLLESPTHRTPPRPVPVISRRCPRCPTTGVAYRPPPAPTSPKPRPPSPPTASQRLTAVMRFFQETGRHRMHIDPSRTSPFPPESTNNAEAWLRLTDSASVVPELTPEPEPEPRPFDDDSARGSSSDRR